MVLCMFCHILYFHVCSSFFFFFSFLSNLLILFLSVLYNLFPFYSFLIYSSSSHGFKCFFYFWSAVHLPYKMLSIWPYIFTHLGQFLSSSLFIVMDLFQLFLVSHWRSWKKETALTPVIGEIIIHFEWLVCLATFETQLYGRIYIF